LSRYAVDDNPLSVLRSAPQPRIRGTTADSTLSRNLRLSGRYYIDQKKHLGYSQRQNI
jgi:hypothetical protein